MFELHICFKHLNAVLNDKLYLSQDSYIWTADTKLS